MKFSLVYPKIEKKDIYRENDEVEEKYFTALVKLTAWQWMSTGLDSENYYDNLSI